MSVDLLAEVEGFLGLIRRGKSVNVNDQATKDRVTQLARSYFSDLRPQFLRSSATSKDVTSLDAAWQDLVRLAHGNNARTSYLRSLRLIRSGLIDLSITLVLTPNAGVMTVDEQLAPQDALLLRTLEGIVPTAAASYRQGLADLLTGRVSYRGTAAEFREAMRETLDYLAPDDGVSAQPGFKLEQGQTHPTMSQKARFVLVARGRNKAQRQATEKSAALVEELTGGITRAVYTRASVAIHTQQAREEVMRLKRYVDAVLFDLLELQE